MSIIKNNDMLHGKIILDSLSFILDWFLKDPVTLKISN